MQILEPVADGAHDRCGLFERQRFRRCVVEHRTQRDAFEKLHHEVIALAVAEEVERLYDVRMGSGAQQRIAGLQLVDESLLRDDTVVDALQRYVPLDADVAARCIARIVNLAEAPAAEPAHWQITVADRPAGKARVCELRVAHRRISGLDDAARFQAVGQQLDVATVSHRGSLFRTVADWGQRALKRSFSLIPTAFRYNTTF